MKRPSTAHPTRSNGSRQPALSDRALEAKVSVHSPPDKEVGTCEQQPRKIEAKSDVNAGSSAIDERLSAELLRILEERSLVQSPQKVSPHKEVAERASEECPRQPLAAASSMSGKHKSGPAKSSLASRLTPCAPTEPKVSSHSRKTVKVAPRHASAGVRSRPQTAGPSMARNVTNGTGHDGGEGERDSAAAVPKRKSSEHVIALNTHRNLSAGPPSREQQQAEKAGPTSSERSRERNFNRPTFSTSARSSKEWSAHGGQLTSAAEGAAPRSRAGEKGKTGAKGRSTIADLIARFRNGPPLRPEERKASEKESYAASTTVFWWHKRDEAKAGEAQRDWKGSSTADSQLLQKDGSEWHLDMRDSGSDNADPCEDLTVGGNVDAARRSSGMGGRPSSGKVDDSDVAALGDAWCEAASQQKEAASRGSLESTTTFNLSRASAAFSEVELRRSGSNSDVWTEGSCTSPRASVESLDHRASVALRHASAMDSTSTIDATDSPGQSSTSSRPSGLNSQVNFQLMTIAQMCPKSLHVSPSRKRNQLTPTGPRSSMKLRICWSSGEQSAAPVKHLQVFVHGGP